MFWVLAQSETRWEFTRLERIFFFKVILRPLIPNPWIPTFYSVKQNEFSKNTVDITEK